MRTVQPRDEKKDKEKGKRERQGGNMEEGTSAVLG
jgi:hypothetical protein